MGDSLGPIDEAFHASYAAARDAALQDGPVLVLLGDELTLVSGTADASGDRHRVAYDVSPDLFHALKAIAHLPIAIFAMLQRDGSRDLPRLREHAVRADATLAQLAAPYPAQQEAHTVLRRSCAFIDEVLSGVDDIDTRLQALATELGPALLRLTSEATRAQLVALHARVVEILAGLDDDGRRTLHVVVAGNHQARARSLGMQYFRRMLGEPDGAEDRVSYAEAVGSVDDAVRLVGVQRLDRAMARAFFGDEKRLQRDVLGDAAQDILERSDVLAR